MRLFVAILLSQEMTDALCQTMQTLRQHTQGKSASDAGFYRRNQPRCTGKAGAFFGAG